MSNAQEKLPPAALMARVAGSTDEAWFEESGRRTTDEWARALGCFGKTFSDFKVIIDFGCGCGRALRHLRRRLAPSQTLIGLDPDKEAIEWVAENLPDVTAYALDERPPVSQVRSGSANLILCHSVFTHLPESVQFEWLSELARVLIPGGILVASIHGAKVVAEYYATLVSMNQQSSADRLSEMMRSHGFFHVLGKSEFERALPSYYGAAFHDIRYIAQHWTKEFKLRAWFPVFALDHQDVLVLSRM